MPAGELPCVLLSPCAIAPILLIDTPHGSLKAVLVERDALHHLQALTAFQCRASTVTQSVVFFLISPPADQQDHHCMWIFWQCLQDTDNLLTSLGCGFFSLGWLLLSPQNPSTELSSLLAVAVGCLWFLSVFSCFAGSFNAALSVLRLREVASVVQTACRGSCLCWPWDLLRAVCFPKEVSFQDSICFL